MAGLADVSPEEALGAGIAEQLEELAPTPLEVTGEVPEWLRGGLIRLTPSQKTFGDRTVDHWFDGAAMLHRFAITDDGVIYSNRFLDTDFRREAIATGGASVQGFATDPCRSLFGRVQSLWRTPPLDNANVNIVRLGDEHIAMTETPMGVSFDPETLATTGRDPVPLAHGQTTTAHPCQDPVNGDLLNISTRMGAKTEYRILRRTGPAEDELTILARHPSREPGYMHSFAVTDRHVLLLENPLVVQPLKLAAALTLGAGSFIGQFRWKPELGLRVHAFDRESGARVRSWQLPAQFVFHTINAYEDAGAIELDVSAHPDASIIALLGLDNLTSDQPVVAPLPKAVRLTLPLGAGEATARVLCDDVDLELPRINHRRCNGRPYRYVYGNAARDAVFIKDIVKIDVETGEHLLWSEPDAWAGEPVFVARGDTGEEDDGVLLSVVLDGATGTSFLLVLDAADLSEIARAEAPHRVPFGFHGNFVR
ncbi:MAG: carotenoid oxygenase family protein [Baekduia sp.]